LSTKKPRPTSAEMKGVTIRSAEAFESTLFDLPCKESCTSMPNRARSVGVVQRPAAAISG
jgi:hypothetical protein